MSRIISLVAQGRIIAYYTYMYALRVDKDMVLSRMELLGLGSQRALAQRAGLDYYNLNRIVNGSPFSSSSLSKLCEALSCHPVEILEVSLRFGKERKDGYIGGARSP